MAAKITKSALLKEIEIVLQDLNLVKSALQANAHPKQQELEDFKKRFNAIVNKKK
ncbi:MAG TPA: hypothetical protein VD816_11685 [Ohtaekwangia sp.]|nr:hypothetical protein [Ohtaekwangia sp.]